MAFTAVQGPLGFISDLHGNLPALSRVMHELAQLGVKQTFIAGDLFLGGDSDPLEVWSALQHHKVQCIRGLSDTALCTVDPDSLEPKDDAEQLKADAFLQTRDKLGEVLLERLRRLPDRIRIPMVDGREVLMVHGSPVDATVEMGHDLSDEELLARVGDDPADMIVCGATHLPFQKIVAEVHIVNVGSVGAAPEGNTAHYTVITPSLQGTEVLQDYVEL